jgi:Flp pilus assembly protein TadD
MMTLGEYTAAVAPLLVSLDYAPNRGWVYRRLGNALVQVGRLADARASYRAYLRFSPPDPDMERTIEAITEALEEKEASGP